MDGTAIKAMMAEIAPVIRDYVAEAQAPLLDRISSLEAEKGALAARCEALEEVASKAVEIDLRDVEKLIEAEIAKIPAPDPPKEIDREELAAMVGDAVSAIPPPKDGKSVDEGALKDAILADVANKATEILPSLVDAAVKALPVPRSVVGALVNRHGEGIFTYSDGSTENIGQVIGKDGEKGEPGKDGRDGFSLEDFDVEAIDERSIDLRFRKGDVTHSFELKFPVPVYRGVFKQGESYVRGDLVTWGGSLHHCNEDTTEKPDVGPWTIAAKKGRDGKDAKHGC